MLGGAPQGGQNELIQNNNEQIKRLEQQKEVLDFKIAVLEAVEALGIEDLPTDSSAFIQTEQTVKDLMTRGLDQGTAISLASVQVGIYLAETEGLSKHELINAIRDELPEVIKILTTNPLVKSDENIETIIRRVEHYMNSTSDSLLFIDALTKAINEREDAVMNEKGVDGYIDNNSVVSMEHPHKGFGDKEEEKNLESREY